MESQATSSSNVDISKFLTVTESLEVARSTLEDNSSDPVLLRMLEEGLHADITLKAQGGTVKAHRSVLASASPVFQAMFQHDMMEHRTSTVDLLDMTIDSLQLFLLLLYATNERSDRFEMVELEAAVGQHFDEVYFAAEKFQVVRRLKVVLIAALAWHLTPGNYWDYYHKVTGSLLSEHGTTEVFRKYVLKNFKEVVKSESTILEMRRDPELVQKCIVFVLAKGFCCGKSPDALGKLTLKRKKV